ncbi:hypothetical protein [Streptomyces cyaneofuscatus]|uniref:hypothetical protein n=1 Tax=Streptomyces cyaneofuscatus TaxID=66883 RepID=UPI0036DC2203
MLPLHLVEDDVTQSRLGEARSKPQRPVAAFAKLLEQGRGDSVVSNLLREPSALVWLTVPTVSFFSVASPG